MAARIIELAKDHAKRFRTYERQLRLNIATNPGITFPELRETDLTITELRNVLDVLENAFLVLARSDFSGVPHFYTTKAWYNALTGSYKDAHDWLSNVETDGPNSGKTEADMGISLGVAEEVTVALTDMMRASGRGISYVNIG